MQIFLTYIQQINAFLWNYPMLILLLGTHLYFTIRTGFIQKKLPLGIRLSFTNDEDTDDGISPYSALATSLAATIGTGNIIGISAAISIGGPGAVFWCWITGFFGIATCYAESFLASTYRIKDEEGNYLGGPMYILKNVLHRKYSAVLFALFTCLASFGIGSSVQGNSICTALTGHLSLSPHFIGIVIALLAGIIIIGGVKQIAKVCTYLVPFMSLFYLLGCGYLLIQNFSFVPRAIMVIIQSAFSAKSFIGGMAGTAIHVGIRTGISKGLFTNEAGLGSIPITSAATNCSSPVKQGYISMTGPFWDTVVICAITGIVIVSTMLRYPTEFLTLDADRLCFVAFSKLPFAGEEMLSLSLILFAFATIIGWCYYGECSIRFLVGKRGIAPYQIIYLVSIYLGAISSLEIVWELSDLLNSLMTIPNLLCLFLLRKLIFASNNP